MMTTGLEYGGVECCMRPAARYSSRIVSICLATRGFTRWGREVTGELSGGTETSNGRREHEPKSVSDVEDICELDQGVPQLGYDVWVRTRAVKIE